MDDLTKARATKAATRQAELDAKVMARAAHLVVPTEPREPLPPDSPGNRWARDWRWTPTNLWGLRKGEDGR